MSANKHPMFFFYDSTGIEQGHVLKDYAGIDLEEAKRTFIELWNRDDTNQQLTENDVDARWGYVFPGPKEVPKPELKYWRPHNWEELNDLRDVVARVLPPGWTIEDEMGSGAWLWSFEDKFTGYATPEWEGLPGIAFLRFYNTTATEDEQIQLTLELTGDFHLDALRIVLKVVNQFERGY